MRDVIERFLGDNKGRKLADLWDLLLASLWRERYKEVLSDIEAISASDAETILKNVEIGRATRLSKSQKDTIKRLIAASRDRGVEPIDVLTAAKTHLDPLSVIIRNPTKSNPYEIATTIHMRNLLNGEEYPVVAQTSEMAVNLRFGANGEVKIGPGRAKSFSKSADLIVLHQNELTITIYIFTLKFARVAGGHQDNQLNDVEEFIGNSERSLMQSECHKAIVDHLNTKLGSRGIQLEGKEVLLIPGAILDGAFFAGCNIPHTPVSIIGDADDVAASIRTRHSKSRD